MNRARTTGSRGAIRAWPVVTTRSAPVVRSDDTNGGSADGSAAGTSGGDGGAPDDAPPPSGAEAASDLAYYIGHGDHNPDGST